MHVNNTSSNPQLNETGQSSKNIWLNIILIFITAIIAGGGVYTWQYFSIQNENQRLQAEIRQLNQRITQLEKITNETDEVIQADDIDTNDVAEDIRLDNLTRVCSNFFTNYNQPVDEKIINSLNAQNDEFREYTSQGYSLSEVCKYTNKNLLFLDFQKGYLEKAGSVNDEELYELAKNAVLGVADSMYHSIDFYPVKIDDYRFEGTGAVACNFDKVEDNKILYICVDASDAGESKTWYAYDLNQQNNIKVKYIYQGRYDEDHNKEEILDTGLLNLFSEKN